MATDAGTVVETMRREAEERLKEQRERQLEELGLFDGTEATQLLADAMDCVSVLDPDTSSIIDRWWQL